MIHVIYNYNNLKEQWIYNKRLIMDQNNELNISPL